MLKYSGFGLNTIWTDLCPNFSPPLFNPFVVGEGSARFVLAAREFLPFPMRELGLEGYVFFDTLCPKGAEILKTCLS